MSKKSLAEVEAAERAIEDRNYQVAGKVSALRGYTQAILDGNYKAIEQFSRDPESADWSPESVQRDLFALLGEQAKLQRDYATIHAEAEEMRRVEAKRKIADIRDRKYVPAVVRALQAEIALAMAIAEALDAAQESKHAAGVTGVPSLKAYLPVGPYDLRDPNNLIACHVREAIAVGAIRGDEKWLSPVRR